MPWNLFIKLGSSSWGICFKMFLENIKCIKLMLFSKKKDDEKLVECWPHPPTLMESYIFFYLTPSLIKQLDVISKIRSLHILGLFYLKSFIQKYNLSAT